MAKQPIILSEEIIPPPALVRAGLESLPAIIRAQGERAARRFIEFFTATIRNRNTRMAYARAVKRFFDWCDEHHLGLEDIEPIAIAAYIEELGSGIAKPSVKQHLAAIRQLFDYLVTGHHSLDEYLHAGIAAAGIGGDKKGPLFRTFKRGDKLTNNPMIRSDVLYMIKRRAKGAGLPYSTCCHTFRATGITAYLQNGGTLEHAQQIAAHQSPRTTKLYDRTKDEISLDEVERIKF